MRLCVVGQNRQVVLGCGLRRNLPNEGQRVLAGRAEVAGRVRRPPDRVHRRLVVAQHLDGHGRTPDVEDDDLRRVQLHRGQVVGVPAVPDHSEQRAAVRGLEHDRRVLEAPQVEEPDTAVATDAGEHVAAVAKGDVVNLFFVRNELRERALCLDVPHAARRVDAGRADKACVCAVPVERRQRRTEVSLLVVVQAAARHHFALFNLALFVPGVHFPQPKVVAGRREQIGGVCALVRQPHDFSCGVRVTELSTGHQLILLLVKLHNVNAVLVFLDVGRNGEPVRLIRPHRPAQCVRRPRQTHCVNLFSLASRLGLPSRRGAVVVVVILWVHCRCLYPPHTPS
eukprot:Rhum_TRINITY_DN14613_c36_g1::Rhum_TRINITY_DN14613_c36_g1_i1::g.109209::m.109209